MIKHININHNDLLHAIRKRKINWGGNQKLRIYGTLKCRSGKRMNRENRVFFFSEEEAAKTGFRPCGHCMKSEYQKWKNGII